jgi:hypothetical protein
MEEEAEDHHLDSIIGWSSEGMMGSSIWILLKGTRPYPNAMPIL